MLRPIACPSCRRMLRVADEHSGRLMVCPACRFQFHEDSPPVLELAPEKDPSEALTQEPHPSFGWRHTDREREFGEREPHSPRLVRKPDRGWNWGVVAPVLVALLFILGAIGATVALRARRDREERQAEQAMQAKQDERDLRF